jgi:hypothetical protein
MRDGTRVPSACLSRSNLVDKMCRKDESRAIIDASHQLGSKADVILNVASESSCHKNKQ